MQGGCFPEYRSTKAIWSSLPRLSISVIYEESVFCTEWSGFEARWQVLPSSWSWECKTRKSQGYSPPCATNDSWLLLVGSHLDHRNDEYKMKRVTVHQRLFRLFAIQIWRRLGPGQWGDLSWKGNTTLPFSLKTGSKIALSFSSAMPLYPVKSQCLLYHTRRMGWRVEGLGD